MLFSDPGPDHEVSSQFIVGNHARSAKQNNIQSPSCAVFVRKTPGLVDSDGAPAQDRERTASGSRRAFHPKFTSPRA
jgi:hypothetical protein